MTLSHRIHILWRLALKIQVVKNYIQRQYGLSVQHVLSELFTYTKLN
jgi:hypothetical protein